jgi:hypothetical protein
MFTTALVLGQPQMDRTNSTVLYAIGGVVLVGLALVVWRLYAKSKLAAGNRTDEKHRPR